MLGKASSHSLQSDQSIERISPRDDRFSIRVRSGLPIPAGYPLLSRDPLEAGIVGGPSTPPSLESGIDSIAPPPEGEKAADAACAVDGGI